MRIKFRDFFPAVPLIGTTTTGKILAGNMTDNAIVVNLSFLALRGFE